MTTEQHQTGFLERFDGVQRRMRVLRVTLVLGLAATALAAIVALLATLDFYLELEAGTRSLLLGLLGAAVALAVVASIWRLLVRWRRPTTASAIEHRFPELGQSVRTTIQYGADPEFDACDAGVAPTLVEALETTTLHRAAPLRIETVVPKRRSYAAVIAGVAAAVALAASTAVNWEWSTAVRRALTADLPYTTLAVAPGTVEVEEGRDVTLQVDLAGRTERTVVLQTRAAGSSEQWSEYELSPETMVVGSATQAQYQSRLAKVMSPLEYRFVAGPVASDTYLVDVRYPIAIESIEAEIEPPAYTGLPVKTVPDGNITALEGSRVRVRIQLDRPPLTAEAVLKRIGVRDAEGQREQHVPLTIEDRTIVLELDSVDDMQWSLVAESRDGSRLPDNSYRMRVRYDQPPQVSFADPDEDLEVHTLAEVLMRIQARDDYGLSNSGIMFQINNGEEYPLLQEDFAAAAEAAEEIAAGEAAPRTLAVLQELLPLESFLLTQRDCVVYYAFAEDNYPTASHRSESDLRFIDIRPFRQTFRLREPGDGDGANDGTFTSLEELIRRQRYSLNRTLRLDRRADEFGAKDLVTMDRLVDYQTEIADLTRELAEGLIANGADDVDVLFQAEAAMFSAVNALQVAELDTAFIQQKDAQQFLVEARNQLEIELMQAQNNSTLRRALGLLNSRISQKLRRMDDDADRESAEALVERLQRLARTEEEISEQLYAAAAQMASSGGSAAGSEPEPTDQDGQGPGGDDPPPEEPDENDDSSNEPGPGDAETSPSSPDLNDLETMQYDAVTEARDVQQLLNEMEGVTDLARDRMEAAAQTADEAAGTLAAGDTDGSAEQTGAAAGMFAELARHAAALLAQEASEQVSRSRDMAAQIADRQRSLADELQQEEPRPGSAGGSGEADAEEPVQQSQRAAERARTLEDVLQAIARSSSPEDGDASDGVAQIMAQQQVPETVERIEQVPGALDSEPTPESLAELADLADRMELTANQLDQLYRSIVMPRIELLRELEQEAVALEQQAPQSADPRSAQGWERELDELLQEVEQAGASTAASEELQNILAGLSGTEDARWERAPDGGYSLPDAHGRRLRQVIEDLQQQIQELVLIDLLADRIEAAPPEYEPLIEQYLKVLSETAVEEQ